MPLQTIPFTRFLDLVRHRAERSLAGMLYLIIGIFGLNFIVGCNAQTAPLPAQTSPPARSVVFSTSFTINEGWTMDREQFDSNGGFAGIQTGVSHNGAWTSHNGSKDLVTAQANNPSGVGGRGLRHWRGDGSNNGGGGMSISLPAAYSEVWVRWYMRYQKGFSWLSGKPYYTKDIYWHGPTSIQVAGFSYGILYTHVSSNSPSNIYSSDTWSAINGGAAGDGLFHCYEQHMKTDTNGTDGVLQMWRDGMIVLDVSNINYNGSTFEWFQLGENQTNPQNGGVDVYTDYDDIAVSTAGQIGCLRGAPPP